MLRWYTCKNTVVCSRWWDGSGAARASGRRRSKRSTIRGRACRRHPWTANVFFPFLPRVFLLRAPAPPPPPFRWSRSALSLAASLHTRTRCCLVGPESRWFCCCWSFAPRDWTALHTAYTTHNNRFEEKSESRREVVARQQLL